MAAKREFRTKASLEAEADTRDRIPGLLGDCGFTNIADERRQFGTAISQAVSTVSPNGHRMRIHVRLCWRRDGRNLKENEYSAAQLRARLRIDGDWDDTLDYIAEREAAEGNTHDLFVQYDGPDFVFGALVPCDQIKPIWKRQADVSDDLIQQGKTGRTKKNHARNGASPTIWLQDDRTADTPAVAAVLWNWPGVVNLSPLRPQWTGDEDTFDDLPLAKDIGRDIGTRTIHIRSGYPRDPKVREQVLNRAAGVCERAGCGERRDYPGFLDVHHILGVWSSDRVFSCVALCPNCHREAHFAPDKEAINAALYEYARRF